MEATMIADACIPYCDAKFPLGLSELYDRHIVRALPSYENLLHWHKLLIEYALDDSSILLIRKNAIEKKDVRGKIICGRKSGVPMLMADNSPAWAVLQYCFLGWRPSLGEWRRLIQEREIPCHFFKAAVGLRDIGYNARGWHIAHIEDINDRSAPHGWDATETRRKCLRFIHPINMFPFPLGPHWEFGGDPRVKAFIRNRYDERYRGIRTEFLRFLRLDGASDEANSLTLDKDNAVILITEPRNAKDQGGLNVPDFVPDLGEIRFTKEPAAFRLSDGREGVCWEYTRLIFWREPIESLRRGGDLIAVKVTPSALSAKHYEPGDFVFTKSEFENLFANVLKSQSYCLDGRYHFSQPPAKAMTHFIPHVDIIEKAPTKPLVSERSRIEGRAKRIFVPSRGVEDWQALLAEPNKQWKPGFSAEELARRWEEYDDFPPEIQALFRGCDDPALREPELLLAIPEHKVDLPGGNRASQNDIFALAKVPGGLVSMTIEGKVDESFGEAVGGWLKNASEGRKVRLNFLRDCLGFKAPFPDTVRYQLIHRMASAVIEAERFGAKYAVMIIHSFGHSDDNFEDYSNFLSLFGAIACKGHLTSLGKSRGIELFSGWA